MKSLARHALRSRLYGAIRRFFDARGYTEVDTPLLSSHLIPESCLEVFKTHKVAPKGGGGAKIEAELYLIPSPEVYMKEIIAAEKQSVYQITKCFRNGESVGAIHNSEFTMLEYYTMDADASDSVQITEDLFSALLREVPSAPRWLSPPFLKMTIDAAFAEYAGFSLIRAVENGSLKAEAEKRGIHTDDTSVPVLFDLLFVQEVEPRLPKNKVVVLEDYPAFVPTLARLNPEGKTRGRWELYASGIELANCYSEETDAARVRAFFEDEAREKEARALVPHAVNMDYPRIFKDFPRCSGAAMGLDRLIMLLEGEKRI